MEEEKKKLNRKWLADERKKNNNNIEKRKLTDVRSLNLINFINLVRKKISLCCKICIGTIFFRNGIHLASLAFKTIILISKS